MKLIDFLLLHKFEKYTAKERKTTDIVRIYYGKGESDWFDFGVYDFSFNTEHRIREIINRDILDKHVKCFCDDDDSDRITIYLKGE